MKILSVGAAGIRARAATWLLLAGLAALPPGTAVAQSIEWVRQFGTSRFDAADDAAADAAHVYVVGRVGSGQSLDGPASAGGVDTWLRKYDAAGNVVWSRQFGTAGFDGFAKLAVDGTANVAFVAGLTTGAFAGQSNPAGAPQLFVRRQTLDSGDEQWTVQLGAADGAVFPLAAAAAGEGVVVFGFTKGVLDAASAAGGSDFFGARFAGNGALLWLRQFGSGGDDPAVFSLGGLAVDASGIYVGSTVPQHLPGQMIVGDADAFLRKYDLDGNVLWTRQFGTACSDVLSSLAVRGGRLYVAGATNGALADPYLPRCTNPPPPHNNYGDSGKAFVQQWTTDGDWVWSRQYAGSSGLNGFSLGIGLAVTGDGVFVASEAIVPRARVGAPDSGARDPACPIGRPQEDIEVRKYDLAGNRQWTRTLGSTMLDVPSGIAANATGVYLAGVTQCRLGAAASAGSADALVIRLTDGP